jgi:hypothetical protein
MTESKTGRNNGYDKSQDGVHFLGGDQGFYNMKWRYNFWAYGFLQLESDGGGGGRGLCFRMDIIK